MANKSIFLALFSLLASVIAAPITTSYPDTKEHIVIIDKDSPEAPHAEDVLGRLSLHSSHPSVRHVYNNTAFRGFSAHLNSTHLSHLSESRHIKLVEETKRVYTAATEAYQTRTNSPWGLERISTASSVSGDPSDLGYTYAFANTNLGAGAHIYIIDTGIYTANQVFAPAGRVSMVWSYNGNMTDLDGHGTHVSGTASGQLLGVASNATVFGFKALDGEGGGSSSDVVAAIDQAISHHSAQDSSTYTGAVMSLSLASSSPIEAMNLAITSAVDAGIHTVVAAGNDGSSACNVSPASVGGDDGPAITVGALDISAAQADFTNTGSCVDVYAPGVNVISAWIGGVSEVNILSGTSMSTPHVTGVVAYAMANATLARNPAAMKAWIRDRALVSPDNGGYLVANNGVLAGASENTDEVLGLQASTPEELYAVVASRSSGPQKLQKRSWRSSTVVRGEAGMSCRHKAQTWEDMRFLRDERNCGSPPSPLPVALNGRGKQFWRRGVEVGEEVVRSIAKALPI